MRSNRQAAEAIIRERDNRGIIENPHDPIFQVWSNLRDMDAGIGPFMAYDFREAVRKTVESGAVTKAEMVKFLDLED